MVRTLMILSLLLYTCLSVGCQCNGIPGDNTNGDTNNPPNGSDEPGITVNPVASLHTTEGGGIDSFTVVLDSEPAANVTIALASSDTTEGTVLPASLTFTADNWDTPQTVTITGVDDAAVDGDVAYTVTTAAATSNDADYDGLDAADVAVTNIDNDDIPAEVDGSYELDIPTGGSGSLSNLQKYVSSLTIVNDTITVLNWSGGSYALDGLENTSQVDFDGQQINVVYMGTGTVTQTGDQVTMTINLQATFPDGEITAEYTFEGTVTDDGSVVGTMHITQDSPAFDQPVNEDFDIVLAAP